MSKRHGSRHIRRAKKKFAVAPATPVTPVTPVTPPGNSSVSTPSVSQPSAHGED